MPFSAKHAAALLLVAAPLAFAQAPNATSLDNSTSSENVTDFSLDQYGIYLNASNFNASAVSHLVGPPHPLLTYSSITTDTTMVTIRLCQICTIAPI